MKRKKRSESVLVFLDGNEPFTTSDIIAEHSGNSRHAVQSLIDKYGSDFKEFGRGAFEMRPLRTKGGVQEVKVYHLNEEQATLLLTYLKNTERIRTFKKELVRQFFELRRLLLERQSAQWQQTRLEGKAVRRLETDAIKAFVEYAAANGSRHPEQYYVHFTAMAYAAVGVEPGQRDKLPVAAQVNLQLAELVVSRAVWAELAAETEYHKAFQNVKAKVQQMKTLAFGPLPVLASDGRTSVSIQRVAE